MGDSRTTGHSPCASPVTTQAIVYSPGPSPLTPLGHLEHLNLNFTFHEAYPDPLTLTPSPVK